MILIQEFHQVAGRSEIPFEEAYRDELLPALQDAHRLPCLGEPAARDAAAVAAANDERGVVLL